MSTDTASARHPDDIERIRQLERAVVAAARTAHPEVFAKIQQRAKDQENKIEGLKKSLAKVNASAASAANELKRSMNELSACNRSLEAEQSAAHELRQQVDKQERRIKVLEKEAVERARLSENAAKRLGRASTDQSSRYEAKIQALQKDYERQLSEAVSASSIGRIQELQRTLQTQEAEHQSRLLELGNKLSQERDDLARAVASNRRYSHEATSLSQHIDSIRLENAALIERNTSLNDKTIAIAQQTTSLVQQVNLWELWGKETYNKNVELVNENRELQRQLHDYKTQLFGTPTLASQQVAAILPLAPLQPATQQQQQPQLAITQSSSQRPQTELAKCAPQMLSPDSKENQVPAAPPSTMVIVQQSADTSLQSYEQIQYHPQPYEYAKSLQHASPLPQPDAASYRARVKERLIDRPRVFNQFIDALRPLTVAGYPQQDVRLVVEQVSQVLRGHDDLIAEFKYFVRYYDSSAADREGVSTTSQPYQHTEAARVIPTIQSTGLSVQATKSEWPGGKRKSEEASPDEPGPKKARISSLAMPQNALASNSAARPVLIPAAPPSSPMTASFGSSVATEPSSAISNVTFQADSATRLSPRTPVTQRTSISMTSPPTDAEHTRTQPWEPTGGERSFFISWLKTYPLIDLDIRRAAAAAYALQQRGWEVRGIQPRTFAVPVDSEHFRNARFGMGLLDEAYPA